MGNSVAVSATLPAQVDRDEFGALCARVAPPPPKGSSLKRIKIDSSALFDSACDDDGVISRDMMMKMMKVNDLYLSHEFGIDEQGRHVYERVKKINEALQRHGLVTFLGDEEGRKPGCILDSKERAKRGVESTQVFLAFITRRYSNLIERNLNAHININLDSGAGSASGDTGELAALEFEHAVGLRGKNFLRAMVPCILDDSMRDPKSWGPRLREILAGRFIVDLSAFEAKTEALSEFCSFITSAVGTPLLRGGPFGRDKAREQTSTRGRQYKWLREVCELSQPQAKHFCNAFAKHGIQNPASLFQPIERDAHYLSHTLNLGESPAVTRIVLEIRKGVRSNIDDKNMIGIDNVLARQQAESAVVEGEEQRKLEAGKAWIREIHELDAMTFEDSLSRDCFFSTFLESVEEKRLADANLKLSDAINFDIILRESEEMLRESVKGSLIRDAELARRRELADMCILQTAWEAGEHARRVAAKLTAALSAGSRPANAVESVLGTADKLPTLVNQPTDTDWHRLLEEIVNILQMVKRLAISGGVGMQQELQDRGVLKVLIVLLSPCCTNTTNMFYIPSPKTRPFLRSPLPFPLDGEPAYTSVSICGVDAIRYLCRCQKDATDMNGNNDRNVFLLGQAGAIAAVLDIIKQHLRAVKRGNLLKQQFAPLLQNRDPRRAKLVGAGLAGLPGLLTLSPSRRGRGKESPTKKPSMSSYASMSHTESVERSTQAVYSGLQCLFSLAGNTAEHPNKVRLAQAGALDTLLMCAQIVSDSPVVFQWAGRLVLLLFSEHSDKNLNGRLSKMLTGQLLKFVSVANSCIGGCTAISHLSFVAALTELHSASASLNGEENVSQANLLAAAAAAVARVKNDVTYWLREKKACETCLEAISQHSADAEGQPHLDGANVVSAAARAIGNLCYRQPETREIFREPGPVQTLIDAARMYVKYPHVLAEVLFAIGNIVDVTDASLASAAAAEATTTTTTFSQTSTSALPTLPGGSLRVSPPASPSPSPSPVSSPLRSGKFVPKEKQIFDTSGLSTYQAAGCLFVSGGAVETLQSGLVYHRVEHPDLCLQAIFCFSKLIFAVLAAKKVTLVERIVCIGTCDQVCLALLAHPTRLDLYICGCMALQSIASSPFDGTTGGTQRILRAGCCEAVVRGIRTSLSAAQTIFAPASVVQSGYVAIDEKSGRNDLLLLSGAAYFIGCQTALQLLKSIRPKDFAKELQQYGIVGVLSGSSPARVRAMMLQVSACHQQGPQVSGFLLAHAAIYIQAACDADHLSQLQIANCASTNNPSLYPRRMELFPLRDPQHYQQFLSQLFERVKVDFDSWADGKN